MAPTDRHLSRRAFTAAALAGTGAAVALPAAQAAPAPAAGGEDARIEEILAGMSIEQKIGRLFVVGYGSRADQAHRSAPPPPAWTRSRRSSAPITWAG